MGQLNPDDMCMVRSAGYRPPAGYRPLFTTQSLPPFTLSTVEWMKRDSQVRLCMAIRKAPFHKVLVHLKGRPDITEFMADQIRRFWTKCLHTVTNAFWYTMCAAEVVHKFNEKTQKYEFWDLLDFYPSDVSLLHVRQIPVGISVKNNPQYGSEDHTSQLNGAIDGGINQSIKMFFPKSFLYLHDREFRSLQGHSEFEYAYAPWLEKTDWQGGLACRKLWYYKNVFNGGILFHPPGEYQTTDGQLIPYADIARSALENAVNGAVWTFAQKYDKEGNPLWSYQPAQVNGGGESILDYIDKLDLEISHGMGIPDDVIHQVGDGGSKAGRSVPLSAFFLSQQETLTKMFRVIDEQIFRPLCKTNFGVDDYEASVEIDIDRLLGTVTSGGVGTSNGPDAPQSLDQMANEHNGVQQMSEDEQPIVRALECPSVRVIDYNRPPKRRPKVIQMSTRIREGEIHRNRSGKVSRRGQFTDSLVEAIREAFQEELQEDQLPIEEVKQTDHDGNETIKLIRTVGGQRQSFDGSKWVDYVEQKKPENDQIDTLESVS